MCFIAVSVWLKMGGGKGVAFKIIPSDSLPNRLLWSLVTSYQVTALEGCTDSSVNWNTVVVLGVLPKV